jgi:NADPH:quinone reductase-like Zn-dependent oxidoreductase
MKAVVQRSYGEISELQVEEVSRPIPGDDEALVEVRAASVHADVWHVVTGLPYVLRLFGGGLLRPKNPVPGTDLSGVVVEVGQGVTRFRPGDEVFGESLRGFQWANGGTYAEFATAPESGLALKPGNVPFEQAATVPTSGLIALPNLQQGGLHPGARVLINGAGGGVGTVALQVAKAEGAHVTAVDHTDKLPLLAELGADQVLDYTRTDFTDGSESYDLVFDVVGTHSFARSRRVLAKEGKYVLIGHDHYGTAGRRLLGNLPRMIGLMLRSSFSPQLPKPNLSPPDRRPLLERLASLLEARQLTPPIARTYPLERAADALMELTRGRALGRIVLTV